MLKSDLSKRCNDILFTDSMAGFTRELFKFADDYDFPIVGGLIITDHSPALTEFTHVLRLPSGYRSDMRLGKIDPVMQFCKHSSEPLVWNLDTYVAQGKSDLWEAQASFDLKSGIALAMHMPRGRHFMIGLAGPRKVARSSKTAATTISDLTAFIAHAQASAFEIHTHGPSLDMDPALSRQDLDLLRVCMAGQTVDLIAERLHLPKEVIKLRLCRVMEKLGCSTRYQAVLRAIRLGFLSH